MSDDPQCYIAACFRAEHAEAYAQMRNSIIEECAQLVEEWESGGLLTDIAAAVRALKMNIPMIAEHLRALKDKP